jgi:hypothetical protein
MSELEPGPKLFVRNLGNLLSVQRPIRSLGASLATKLVSCSEHRAPRRCGDREWLTAPWLNTLSSE